jgi:hypothetical protein
MSAVDFVDLVFRRRAMVEISGEAYAPAKNS